MTKETRFYAVQRDFAEDVCKAIGLDPMRVSRLRFEFRAEDDIKPLVIEVDYLPDYLGLVKPYAAELVQTDIDPLEEGYHASET